MMKRNKTIIIRGGKAILAIVFIGLMALPALAQQGQTTLMLEKSPADGGSVTPGTGIHNLGMGSQITLTAVPKADYQFAYWLGDVSDPTSSRTTAYIDSPKIIIAVFERVQYEFLEADALPKSAPGAGLIPSPTESGGNSGGNTPTPKPTPTPTPTPTPLPTPDDFPVPDGEQVPEPATMGLLALGALLAARNRAKKQK